MVIHCQVITSQVMAHRPYRYCPVIGRAMPHATAAGRHWQRKVILTTLSVTGRYFGRVTGLAGRKPARAGHEPAGGDGRPGGGVAGGRSWSFRAGRLRGRVIVLAGLLTAAAAARQLSPRGILIGWAVYFTGLADRLVPDAIAGHSRSSGNRWPAILCEHFARLRAEVGRVAQPGRGPGRRPGRPGRLGPASPALAGFPPSRSPAAQ